MIIRKHTTKARRADKTTGRVAAPAPLACYRRDARTPASQRREGNPAKLKKGWQKNPAALSGLLYTLLFAGVVPLPVVCCPFGALVVRLRIIIKIIKRTKTKFLLTETGVCSKRGERDVVTGGETACSRERYGISLDVDGRSKPFFILLYYPF